jgi:hypothetical protein
VELLLGWLVLGGIGGVIGYKKGRLVAGILWGMVLGPLGWIIVLMGPDFRGLAPAISQNEPADQPTGVCKVCGHSPVAFDARVCPKCGAENPNPGVTNRFVGRGVVIGLVGGILVGGTAGWFSDKPGMTFGGFLLGSLAGLILGLAGGLIAGVVARLSGKQ